MRTNLLPNLLVYIGPHPKQPHLALFKSQTQPDWFYWDIPENVTPLDEIAPGRLSASGAPGAGVSDADRLSGFRATRPANTLWGRKD